jgi:hypothetical protein
MNETKSWIPNRCHTDTALHRLALQTMNSSIAETDKLKYLQLPVYESLIQCTSQRNTLSITLLTDRRNDLLQHQCKIFGGKRNITVIITNHFSRSVTICNNATNFLGEKPIFSRILYCVMSIFLIACAYCVSCTLH